MSDFFHAMFSTHLPYMIIAAGLIVIARRTRRAVERIVSDLEEIARRRS